MFCSTINWIKINISVLENIVHAPYIMQSWMMSSSSSLLLSGQNRPFSLWGLNSQYLAYRIFCKSWTSETIDLGRRECFENICVALLSWPKNYRKEHRQLHVTIKSDLFEWPSLFSVQKKSNYKQQSRTFLVGWKKFSFWYLKLWYPV